MSTQTSFEYRERIGRKIHNVIRVRRVTVVHFFAEFDMRFRHLVANNEFAGVRDLQTG